MKTLYKFVAAALAVCATMISCTKEPVVGQETGNTSEDARVITVSFDAQPATRTYGGPSYPQFDEGDEILVATEDGSANPEICTVRRELIGQIRRLVLYTRLQGKLVAVYPAESAKMDAATGKKIEGVKVKSVQSGLFADANICMATMENADDSKLTFVNQTALLKFYVGEDVGVNYIKVESSGNAISDDENTPKQITVTAKGASLHEDVSVRGSSDICYVAIKDGVSANTLTFSSTTTSAQNFTKTPKSAANLKKGSVYKAFIPYYLTVNVGTENSPVYQKWAYCNIGSFSPKDDQNRGYYFSWGNTTPYYGYYDNNSNWVFAEASDSENILDGGFTEDNYKSTPGYQLNGNIDAAHDAATVMWGRGWRLPTADELTQLANKYSLMGDYYLGFGPVVLILLGGHYDGLTCDPLSTYWSSTYDSEKGQGFALGIQKTGSRFENVQNEVGSYPRHQGMRIRPIYDDSNIDGARGSINGHDYVIINGKKWATQNVAVSASGQMKWKGAGTSAVKVPGTNEDVQIGDYFQWAAYPGYCGDAESPDKGLLIYESFTNPECVDGGEAYAFSFKDKPEGEGEGEYAFNYLCEGGITPYDKGTTDPEYTKYTSNGDVLEPGDDVAHILWGSTWRMPTDEDFQSLINSTFWADDQTASGFYVFLPSDAPGSSAGQRGNISNYDRSKALLFIPYSYSGAQGTSSQLAYLWSSTLTGNWNVASSLNGCGYDSVRQFFNMRCDGLSIRPISD